MLNYQRVKIDHDLRRNWPSCKSLKIQTVTMRTRRADQGGTHHGAWQVKRGGPWQTSGSDFNGNSNSDHWMNWDLMRT